MKPGATASTRAITRSAYAPSSSASAIAAHVCGTHCVNIDTTCWPSGASVGSNTDGMQMSANGSAAARPATASWNARSMSSSDSASTIVPPCTSGSKPGLAVNSGSRSTATFTFTVPLRVFQRSIAVDEVGRERGAVDLVEERDLRMRRRDHDVGAQLLARLERHAAHAPVAHVDARDRRVGAHRRAVRRAAAARSASLTRPCRLRGSPTSRAGRRPRRRSCGAPSRTRCPASAGPAHTPITPLTDSTPCICGDVNHSSSRSAMLDVKRRVTSPTPRDAEPAQRPREPRLVEEIARAQRAEPRAGSSRAADRARRPSRPSHASQRSYASASARRELRDLGVAARGVVVGELQRAAVAVRHEVAVLRIDLVAVAREVELAHDLGRDEADDVRQRAHLERRAPRLLGRGRAADRRRAARAR